MKLFVTNLTQEVKEEHLRKLFEEFGNLVSVKVVKDFQTGLSRGFGFVEMEDKFMAYDAIDNIDQTYFMGQVIAVKEAKDKNAPQQPSRGGHGGGGNRSFSGGPKKPFQRRPQG